MNQNRAFYFRRKHKRRAIDTPVGTICRNLGYFENAIEVSEGGILVRSGFDYKVGDIAGLCFALPDGGFVSTNAEVVYVIDCNATSRLAGMRFTELSPELIECLRGYVDQDTIHTQVGRQKVKESDLIYGSRLR